MVSRVKFIFSEAQLCQATIAALSMIHHDFPVKNVVTQLYTLVTEAQEYVAIELEQDLKLEKLLELFYKKWRFSGVTNHHCSSEALWLDHVLESRQGTEITLCVILIYIARRLKLPLMPVILPTQMILRADWLDGDMWLINPFNGETLNHHTLKMWLGYHTYPLMKQYEDYLVEAKPGMVVYEMLNRLKLVLMEEQHMEVALNIISLLLQLNPSDPYEIRDRGLIYAQLGCEHIALPDLIYFVEQCPNDSLSEMIRMQIHSIAYKPMTFH